MKKTREEELEYYDLTNYWSDEAPQIAWFDDEVDEAVANDVQQYFEECWELLPTNDRILLSNLFAEGWGQVTGISKQEDDNPLIDLIIVDGYWCQFDASSYSSDPKRWQEAFGKEFWRVMPEFAENLRTEMQCKEDMASLPDWWAVQHTGVSRAKMMAILKRAA